MICNTPWLSSAGPKPRKVNVERTKRHIARTTPDQVTTYVSGDMMPELYERYNLGVHSDQVAGQVLFSFLMEWWVKRMKLKYPDQHLNFRVQVTFYPDYDQYCFVGWV